jgi:hypothetical protein
MSLPDPAVERLKLAKAGREWFAQYLLASLLLGQPPRRLNTAYRPVDRGHQLLRRLDPWSDPVAPAPDVFWEFRLDALLASKGNRWPDLAARWPNRLLLIELKTEPGSVRKRQVDEYLALGLHNFPDLLVDLLYVTRDRVPSAPHGLANRARYATTTWDVIADAIDVVWADAPGGDGERAQRFAIWLREELLTGAPWSNAAAHPSATTAPTVTAPASLDGGPDRLAQGLQVAALVGADRRQRPVPLEFASKDGAAAYRDELLAALAERATAGDAAAVHVRPWVWTATSGGRGLTNSGNHIGIEVRLSYYR